MLGLRPVEIFSINDFQVIEQWDIADGTATTISFILTKSDSLGERRYIPAAGSTVQLSFLRARSANSNSQALTITKTGIAKADDRSMYDVALTAADTENIISGGVKLVINESGSATSVNVPYVIKKSYADPGF